MKAAIIAIESLALRSSLDTGFLLGQLAPSVPFSLKQYEQSGFLLVFLITDTEQEIQEQEQEWLKAKHLLTGERSLLKIEPGEWVSFQHYQNFLSLEKSKQGDTDPKHLEVGVAGAQEEGDELDLSDALRAIWLYQGIDQRLKELGQITDLFYIDPRLPYAATILEASQIWPFQVVVSSKLQTQFLQEAAQDFLPQWIETPDRHQRRKVFVQSVIDHLHTYPQMQPAYFEALTAYRGIFLQGWYTSLGWLDARANQEGYSFLLLILKEYVKKQFGTSTDEKSLSRMLSRQDARVAQAEMHKFLDMLWQDSRSEFI